MSPGLGKRDLSKLQASAIMAVLMLAAGAATVYWVDRQTQAAQRQLDAARARYGEATRKLQQASSEEDELKNKAMLFQQLEARRIIGAESRLDWVELIGSLRQRHRLFDIDYEIAPQQALGTPTGAYQFYGSTMKFRLPLLHEGDLDVFIRDLKREAPAIVQPQKCAIHRLTEQEGNAANLEASCTLQWITLSPQSAGVRQ